MANQPTLSERVAPQALPVLEAELPFTRTLDTSYEPFLRNGEWDTGGRVIIRKPNRDFSTESNEIKPGDTSYTTENDRIVQVTKHEKVIKKYTYKELTYDFDHKNYNRVFYPAVRVLGSQIEERVTEFMVKNCSYVIGTAGVAPANWKNVAKTRAYMNKLRISKKERMMLWDEDDAIELQSNSNLQNINNPVLNKKIVLDYALLRYVNIDHFTTVASLFHTAGTGDASKTPANGLVECGTVKTLVNSHIANIDTGTESTVVLEGVANNSTLKKGDKIKLPNIYSVSPEFPHNTTGRPMTFTVLEDADSAAGTELTVRISPGIDIRLQYRNVSDETGLPVGTPVYLHTANLNAGSAGDYEERPYSINVAYIKSAGNFVAPVQKTPDKGVVFSSSASSPETGISISIVTGYLIEDRSQITRFDVDFDIFANPEYMVGYLGGVNV
jgi:hypothetical protein